MTLVRDRAAIELLQRERLRTLFAEILPHNRFYADKFAGSDLTAIDRLPFTTKSELVADQERYPPYGSALTFPRERYTRLHQTSGTSSGNPLCWLDTPESWSEILDGWLKKFELAKLVPVDRFYFAFSFGPFLGFWTALEAAQRGGWFVLAGGGLSSAARLHAILDHEISIVCCTPTYAMHLADTARTEKIELSQSAVRLVIVAGEPGGGIAAVRATIESAWGARVIDHSGMTETGPMGMECAENPGGMHILENEFIIEVIDPATLTPVVPGTDGELVVTTLGRRGSPLIRYRTGDLVRVDPRPCPCGRPFLRLDGGILGRTDDMIHLRGNNVYPTAIEGVIRSIGDVAEYRLNVDRDGALTELRIEVEPQPESRGNDLADRVSRAIRDRLHFRADVAAVAPGTLPRFEMKARRISRG